MFFVLISILFLLLVVSAVYLKRGIRRPNIILAIPSVLAGIALFMSTGDKSVPDIKYEEYLVKSIRYYPEFKDKVWSDSIKDFRQVTLPEYFTIVYGKGEEVEIPCQIFKYYEDLWNGDLDKSVILNACAESSNNRMIFEFPWDKNIVNSLVYTKTRIFQNSKKRIRLAFGWTDREALEEGLFLRQSTVEVTAEHDSVLSTNQKLIYSNPLKYRVTSAQISEASYISSLTPHYRPILMIWSGEETEKIMEKQREFWSTGKENEVVFCVGVDSKGIIKWSGSFAWNPNNHKGITEDILSGPLRKGIGLSVNNYLYTLRNSLVADLTKMRSEFREGKIKPRPPFQDQLSVKYMREDLVVSILAILVISINMGIIVFLYIQSKRLERKARIRKENNKE